ncbi:MAG: type II/IV secretion system protein [Phycisphaeraceae bacterium]|nr:type II/IV secretion system protein [Phycisphaerales bacterium]MCB9842603.1 type II/IV secretion system protein [Phycisphaeraceae bacterium]
MEAKRGQNGTPDASVVKDGGAIGPSPEQTQTAGRVSRLMPVSMTPEQLARFGSLPGTDEEPWDVLLSGAAADEHQSLATLAKKLGIPFEPEPKLTDSADRFYERIPGSAARRHQVAGIRTEGGALVVATSQPMQPDAFAMVEQLTGMAIELVLAPRAAVANIINRGYEQRQDLVTEIVEDMPLDDRAIERAASSVGGATDLLQLARQTPVIRLVNMMLFEALRRRASDVHIQPLENKLVIRFRIDGMLVDSFSPPLSLAPAISSRLKVMAELDIANRHSPQDGQTTVRIGSRKIDIRLSCVPTIYGERLVLRLLDQSQTQLSLDALGMVAAMQGDMVELINRPNGMILVTGPTGSGKTTTLYAAMEKLDRTTKNVMTIEDPVEYHLEGIAQVQVNVKRGVTFASGLRSLLRQDPDVILVGEIRDEETARLAVQASLTGHLVLATLHTNDAPSAISRMQDIGIEPYLITSSLLAVLAQRLLRKCCDKCHSVGEVDGVRCEKCFGTGYSGRVAIYEVMKISDSIRRMTLETADAVRIRSLALEEGMRPMFEDGMDKVRRGLTTEHELSRVLA